MKNEWTETLEQKDEEIAALKAEIQRLNSTAFTLQKITELKAEVERLRKLTAHELAKNFQYEAEKEGGR